LQILTNVAEAPEGRRILLEHESLIEDVRVDEREEALERHKRTLLEVIRWRA
jgi:hypothetical protein